uniref:Uncharacterized protein n=1 Tax=Cacopsylla melanoneura TaxID=428564 RepID=A0A8D9EJ96_9HEMI
MMMNAHLHAEMRHLCNNSMNPRPRAHKPGFLPLETDDDKIHSCLNPCNNALNPRPRAQRQCVLTTRNRPMIKYTHAKGCKIYFWEIFPGTWDIIYGVIGI